MSLKIDRVQLEFAIKPDYNQQQMQSLEKDLSAANRELNKIERQRDKIAKQKFTDPESVAKQRNELTALNAKYNEQVTAIKKARTALDSHINKVGLANLSVKELSKRQSELNVILRNLNPNTAEFAKYKAQLQEVSGRMKELRIQASTSKMSLSNMANGFNKYSMLVTSAVASLTGLTMTIRKCTNDFAQMEEEEYQVVKYTGMTKAEVDDLNDSFKKMDTRTSRENLNKLADDAGRLGITGKEKILQFVDAADKINVALGDDLGEGATKTIGKLASMFGEDTKYGLNKAMLKTGSVINELSQSSSAAGGYIADFTARLAGVGKQAGLTQAQIMSYASVLDQSMQQDETASTAMSQLITKMFQDPAKFAKLAGADIKEFSNELKTDANSAIIDFLSAMKSKGGFAELAPMFESMGLNGSRATGVLSSMADKLGKLSEAQTIANKAYSEGTSLTKEFNVQNNTTQAKIDKNVKKFKDLSVVLGQQLMPVVEHTITAGSATIRILSKLVTFISKYSFAIISLTAVLATYLIAQSAVNKTSKIYIAYEKACAAAALIKRTAIELLILSTAKLNGKNALAIATERTLTKAMLAFPGTWLATAIAALIVVFVKWEKTMFDTKRYTRELNESIKEEKKKNDERKESIEKLLPVAQDETKTTKERKDAINRLKSIMPDYFKKLDIETAKHYRVAAAIQASNKQYKDKLMLMASEAGTKYANARADYMKNHPQGQQVMVPGTVGTQWTEQADLSNLNALKDAAQTAAKAVDDLNKKENASTKFTIYSPGDKKTSKTKNNNGSSTGGTGSGSGSTGGGGSTGTDDKSSAALASAEENYKKQLNALKTQKKDMQITDDQYHDESYKAEISYLVKKGNIQKKYGQSTVDTEGEILDKIINETDYQAAEKKKQKEKNMNDSLAALDDSANADRIALSQDFMNGQIKDEEEYNAKKEEIEEDYQKQKLAIIKEYGGDTSTAESELNATELSKFTKSRNEELAAIKDQMSRTTNVDEKQELNNTAYNKNLISYKEYQKNKTEIANEESDKRKETQLAALDAVSSFASSASNLYQAMQTSETTKVEKKYNKLIKAAQKAGKSTTKLEEEEEEEKNKIKKKYADKEFKLTVLSIIAKTAESIMTVDKTWAGNPVMAAVLKAVAVADGVTQLASAKASRDEAAGLYEGGYANGYTGDVLPRKVAGVIPVHGNEFVANHVAVANPSVRQFLDVFDNAQKNGTISMLNTTDILQRTNGVGGMASGGYTNGSSNVNFQRGGISADNSKMTQLLEQIMDYTKQTAQKETVTIRDVRKQIKHIDHLESNASR